MSDKMKIICRSLNYFKGEMHHITHCNCFVWFAIVRRNGNFFKNISSKTQNGLRKKIKHLCPRAKGTLREHNFYKVSFSTTKGRLQKCFKTLNDAKRWRDNAIRELGIIDTSRQTWKYSDFVDFDFEKMRRVYADQK